MRLFILLCLFPIVGFGQQVNSQPSTNYTRHEFYVWYGQHPIAELIGEGVGSAVSTGLIRAFFPSIQPFRDELSSIGIFGVGYNRYLSRRWTVGISGNYLQLERKRYQQSDNQYVGMVHSDYYRVWLKTDFRYINRPRFQMYLGGIVGYGFVKQYAQRPNGEIGSKSNFDYVPLHLTALGLRFGRNIGVFLEGGMGSNGLINAGISGKF